VAVDNGLTDGYQPGFMGWAQMKEPV